MIKLGYVAVASAALAAGLVGAACSSSSSGGVATPTSEAGVDSGPIDDGGTGVIDAADGGGTPSGSHTLVWNVVTTPPTDGGVNDASATGDASLTDAAVFDGGASGDGGAPDANTGDASAAPSNVPVSGAKICVYQMPAFPCVTTDAKGLFTMTGLPSVTNFVLSVEKDGYRPALRAIQTASGEMDGTANPISIQLVGAADSGINTNVDWQTKGVVSFFAIAPLPGSDTMFGGDPGARLTLSPAAGDGPYFLYDDGRFAQDASALVATAGVYDNLPPGSYEITVDDPNHNCSPILSPFAEWGYPTPPLSVKFPIVAGFLTGPVGFFCTNKPPLVDAGQ